MRNENQRFLQLPVFPFRIEAGTGFPDVGAKLTVSPYLCPRVVFFELPQ